MVYGVITAGVTSCMVIALVLECFYIRRSANVLLIAILTTVSTAGCIVQLVMDLIHGTAAYHIIYMLFAIVTWGGAAYFSWREWWKRRKKKRVLQQLGYKARAAIAKLVNSMPKPSLPPLRHPAPSPA